MASDRLQGLLSIEMTEHANPPGKARLIRNLSEAREVQFAYEVTGSTDIVALLDCRNMAEFNAVADRLLEKEPIVRRWTTSFVKHQIKFAPFIRLDERG